MDARIPIHYNTNITCPAICRVIMSLARDKTEPGKNYVRIFAGLIRLLLPVVITARVAGAPSPLTTNLSALCARYSAVSHPFTPRPSGVF